ncbi:hypothetical protein ABL78_5630 [Leptomonas seymouri]|uniref:Uncharacterized protein n=1 Tax=Leptomonas seymouri TaxID=5684 RepID=A0A0N1HWL5_LEPSE|nr:hypothetical protein ABL78_5630 [Leptomonas seymouri]|eukprot:KPI85318.1 hypothetical protein ABL78_5630 [Leptomonas seymouri]
MGKFQRPTMSLMSFVMAHRHAIIDYAALLLAVVVCVPFLVFLPESRPYGATFISWTFAFTFHLWRWLPWEQAHVLRAAHRRADRIMLEGRVVRVHRQAEALNATTLWPLEAVAQREAGNYLSGDVRGGGAEGTGSSEGGQGTAVQRKFLQDITTDTTSSFSRMPRLGREEALAEGAADAYSTTSPAPMQQHGLPPLPRISASALAPSSRFLSLPASASPAPPPLSSAPKGSSLYARLSHEPFTDVSWHQPTSKEGSPTVMPSPRLSAIELDGAVTTAPVPFPSSSPVSSCQTHSYVPPNRGGGPAASPLLADHEEEVPSCASRVSVVQQPSRISVISFNAPQYGALALMPREAPREG